MVQLSSEAFRNYRYSIIQRTFDISSTSTVLQNEKRKHDI